MPLDPSIEPATKSDLREVRTELKGAIDHVRTELKGDVHALSGQIHEVRVLVESLQDGHVRILEGMQGMEARLRGEFEGRFARIELRLDMLEQAVRELSGQVAENRRALDELRAELRQLVEQGQRLEDRTRRDDARISDLERRMTAVEAELARKN